MNFSQLGFGIFSLKIYGILLSLIFLYSIWRYYKIIQQKNFPVNFFVHHFWKWFLFGLFGARLVAIFIDYEVLLNHSLLSFFVFWEGGLNFIGFMGFFLVALYFDTRNIQFSLWRWLDHGVIPFLIGVLLNDMANFLTGNVYGIPTSLPWAVQYETFSVDIIDPVHPVSLYAFVLHGILFFWAEKNKSFLLRIPGKFFMKMFQIFIVLQFFLFFLRGDAQTLVLGILKIDQILLLAVLIGVIFLRKKEISSKT